MRTTEPDGRSTRRLKVQDLERLSDLPFKSTEDPYVRQIPEPDGRSTRRLKVQDPERLSDLAFKSTEDPCVPRKYRGKKLECET